LADRFIYLFKISLKGAEKEEMPISKYTEIYYEALKLFGHFGRAVALGFKGKFPRSSL